MTDQVKLLISAIIGNCLEFYDFMLYGLFSAIIATLFFPNGSHQARVMAAFAVLAVGYFARPLGGVLFGHIGDKLSRRKALMIALLAMGVITTLMGCLPSYQTAGLSACVFLVVLRLLQGLTAGGEMAGSMVFLFEKAPLKHQSFISMLSLAGALLGVLLAIVTASVITALFSHAQILAGAWRLPFFLGVVLAIVGGYLRLKLWQDTVQNPVRLPIAALIKTQLRAVIVSFVFLAMPAVFTGITTVYLVPYLMGYFQFGFQAAVNMTFYVVLTMMICVLLGAFLADRVNHHKTWLVVGCALLAVITYPLFVWMTSSQMACVVGILSYTAITSLVLGPEVVFLMSLFKKEVRYSGVGLTHGLTFSVITGTSPLLLNLLAIKFGAAAVSFYFIATCVLAGFAVSFAKPLVIKCSPHEATA